MTCCEDLLQEINKKYFKPISFLIHLGRGRREMKTYPHGDEIKLVVLKPFYTKNEVILGSAFSKSQEIVVMSWIRTHHHQTYLH